MDQSLQQEQKFIKYKEQKPYLHILKGHSSQIIYIFTPSLNSEIIYTVCKEGFVIGWSLIDEKMIQKMRISLNDSEGLNSLLKVQDNEGWNEQEQEKQLNDDDMLQYRHVNEQQQLEEIQKNSKGQSEFEDLQCVIIQDDNIFGSYKTGEIGQWDLYTGELKNIFKYNNSSVNSLLIYQKDILILGGEDFSVKFLNISTLEEKKLEKGYKLSGPINQMELQQKSLFVVADFNMFYQISIDGNKIVKQIKFDGFISKFKIFNEYLILSICKDNFLGGKLAIYNLENLPEIDPQEGQKEYFLPINEYHCTEITSIQIYENYLITGVDDCSVKFWDIDNQFKYVDQISYHQDNISQIVFGQKGENLNYIITGSNDKTIIISNIDQVLRTFKERKLMQYENLWSAKHDAWYECLNKKKKKGKGKGKGKAKK